MFFSFHILSGKVIFGGSINHIWYSLRGRGSVVFWVDPLVLVSVLQVLSNLIGSLKELVVLVVATWVRVEVLLSNSEALELVHGVVVVGDLREGERLLIDVVGVHLE